jgi:hypothetical protein
VFPQPNAPVPHAATAPPAHSSMSLHEVVPLPLNPLAHVHVYEPDVFAH